MIHMGIGLEDRMRQPVGLLSRENLALAAGSGGWFSRVSRADRQRFRYWLTAQLFRYYNKDRFP